MQQPYINYFDLTDKIFLTLAIITLFTSLMYRFSMKMGKPMVMGGIVAGVILSHIHFPLKYFDVNRCEVVGNFGIVLFMMFVGAEFNFKRLLRDKRNLALPAILTIIPFIAGIIVFPVFLYFNLLDTYELKHKILIAFFVGVAVSMSTFSILIMVVNNTKLKFTRVGKIAVLCATFEEGIFWLVMGLIIAFFQQNAEIKLYPLIVLGVYLGVIFLVMPRLVGYVVSRIKTEMTMLGFIVGGCLLSAVVADYVNLQPIFGGFIFGILLPKGNPIIGRLRGYLLEFIVIVLLPVYFVKTGMDASTNLSFDRVTLLVSLVLILISIFGKYGSALIVGKMWNFSNKEVVVLGSLLSIRGTIEVAILNIGREVGLLEAKLYSALVIMTLVTTWIATSVSFYDGKLKKG